MPQTGAARGACYRCGCFRRASAAAGKVSRKGDVSETKMEKTTRRGNKVQ